MTVNLRISLVFVRMWDSAAQKLLPWKCLSTCTDLCHQKVIFLSNIKGYFAPRHHHLWYIPTLTTTLPHVCPCTLWVLAPDKGDRASSQSQCRTFGGLPMDPPFLSRNKTKEKKGVLVFCVHSACLIKFSHDDDSFTLFRLTSHKILNENWLIANCNFVYFLTFCKQE